MESESKYITLTYKMWIPDDVQGPLGLRLQKLSLAVCPGAGYQHFSGCELTRTGFTAGLARPRARGGDRQAQVA